jgi:DivIVA domain-containing protein
VALDRQSIARRDFPTHRRGYDPAAVDAHLAQVAEEVAALRSHPAPLASQAGEQVKAIVEAAERSAQEIRETARAEARDHVARVAEAADRLRARIEAMDADVTRVVSELREGARRLDDDLEALQAGAEELRGAGEPPAAEAAAAARPGAAPAEAEPAASTAGEAARPGAAPAEAEPAASTAGEAARPGAAPAEAESRAAEAAAAAPRSTEPAPSSDADAARIVALDMALSGTPRDETDRYLAEHYDIPDRAELLDEVYAAAGA